MAVEQHLVTAPLVASVWKLLVEAGDPVEADTIVAVLESMKMEIPVAAGIAGSVSAVPVVEGQIVQEDDVIAQIGPL